MAWFLLGGCALASTPLESVAEPTEASPQPPPSRQQRLQQSLLLIKAMPDARPKALLLLELVDTCLVGFCGMEPGPLLDQALGIIKDEKNPEQRVNDLIRVARTYGRLEQPQQAEQVLADAQRQALLLHTDATEEERIRRARLLLQISLAHEVIDGSGATSDLLAESRALLEQPTGPEPFPFQERPARVELGVGAGGNSFTDTSIRADLGVDLYKQWPRQDVYLDGLFALDYDSSRSVVNGRPIGIATLIYRRHLSSKWNLFYDHLLAVNATGFAVADDDEDLSAITSSLVGAGLNLWRGDHPGSFLDLQLGIGPRYEYEYVDFQRLKDKLGAALGLILVGREIPIGGSRLAILFGGGSYLDDWNDGFALLDTTIDIPLSRRWAWSNSLVLRYQADTVIKQNPNLSSVFSSRFTFKFAP